MEAAAPGTTLSEEQQWARVAIQVVSARVHGVDLRAHVVGELIELLLVAGDDLVAHRQKAADRSAGQVRRDVDATGAHLGKAGARSVRDREVEALGADHHRAA
jgi:hypothetical protein